MNRILAASIIFLSTLILFTGCNQSRPPKPVPAKLTPFTCWSGPLSFSDQVADYEVAAVAKLVQESPLNSFRAPTATYEIVDVLKGQSLARVGERVTCDWESGFAVGEHFLVVSKADAGLKWQLNSRLTPADREYVTNLFSQSSAADRLRFYLQQLESTDESLVRDATDELHKVRFIDLHVLKPDLDHERIVARIQDPEITANLRRLYFKLLGICGSSADVPLLEELMRSEDPRDRSGRDGMIGCYLTLQGERGLPLVEELFIKNHESDYGNTYCAIMAVRFHLRETNVIRRERLLESLRLMLDRPELADLVIPDLAEQQDWSCLAQLFELFQTADTENTWLRIPVINYLRRCPLPQAKEMLAECEQIDPEAAKRARVLFPEEDVTVAPGSAEK